MNYFKTPEGSSAIWIQNPQCVWSVSYHPALGVAKISCECGSTAEYWAKAVFAFLEPCTEEEFNTLYNAAIHHQRIYRKEATI
ncbi:MAG: hypothetical protein ACK5XN_29975 [Bacteroidota bacterium]|jgi:hypothetical protein